MHMSRLRNATQQRGTAAHILDERVSPVDRIPNEILGEIFTFCLPDTYVTPSPQSAPLLLLQICRVWRAVSLSTPALWSSISVNATPRYMSDEYCDGIEAWLKRSGACPLHFSLSDAPGVPDTRMLNRALSLFLEHISRWHDVRLRVFAPYDSAALAPLPDSGTPSLERINIAMYSDVPRAWFAPIFAHSENLRQLSWTPAPAFDLLTVGVPWEQLTHLTLNHTISFDECVAILRQSPNLVACRIDVHTYGQHATSTSTTTSPSSSSSSLPISLARLAALELGIHSDRPDILLSQLTLPAARNVVLRQCVQWPQAQFTALLLRSRCALQRLVLSLVNITEDDLLECLRSTSASLEVLNVGEQADACVTDRTLRLLTHTHTHTRGHTRGNTRGRCLAPGLQRIRFYRCMRATDGVLADMVASRWSAHPGRLGHVACLVLLLVHMPAGEEHGADVERLQALQAQGLRMRYLH
ncbi:hypothetical protein PLICRDRAFT_53737 [Plicaturopsis crispa FD-325 SS-3]|nr:hypothetical protein PLICRDRAFT_53737 [Plicaturopsis crispa FD-325 SS-3]